MAAMWRRPARLQGPAAKETIDTLGLRSRSPPNSIHESRDWRVTVRSLAGMIVLLGAIAQASWAQPVPCCPLNISDRVRLLVDNPFDAPNLSAGACGTVLCCDPAWTFGDQLFVSWDNWTDGVNDDWNQCSQTPPAYANNSGWWVGCEQVVVDTAACPSGPPVCGNGLCEAGETWVSCYADCATAAECGNGICEPGEDSTNCPSDCTGSCCDLVPGDIVILLVDNPFDAESLPAGTCGTVVCCDSVWTGTDQTFVSWSNWTLGTNDLGMCDTPPGAYTPNSGWWVACDQAVKAGDADADGVVDCLDQCPDTPAGEVVGANGCGCSQIDCDDGNACTTDSCLDAVCSHTLDYDPATQCCDPTTGIVTTIDDGNSYTVDACDAATGTVTHTDTAPAGECADPVTGALTQIDDNNPCTTDTCNPDGTVTHTPIADCPPTFRLTVMPGGTSADYPAGTCMDVTAPRAPDGMRFESWSGDVDDTTNPVRVCLNRDMTITANFAAGSTLFPSGSCICGLGACGAVLATVFGMTIMKTSFARRRRSRARL